MNAKDLLKIYHKHIDKNGDLYDKRFNAYRRAIKQAGGKIIEIEGCLDLSVRETLKSTFSSIGYDFVEEPEVFNEHYSIFILSPKNKKATKK